jgi:hypothetical protein
MKLHSRALLIWLVSLTLLGGCIWFWYHTFEKRWTDVPFSTHESAQNAMLAASRFLQQNGYNVQQESTLDLALRRLPAHGTMLITENFGSMSSAQADTLLTWIAKGNTLITRPRFVDPSSKTDHKSDEDDEDDNDDKNDDESSDEQNGSENDKQTQDQGTDKLPAQAQTTAKETTQSTRKVIDPDPIATHLGVGLYEDCACEKKPSSQTGEQSSPEKDQATALNRAASKEKKEVVPSTAIQFPEAPYVLRFWLGKRRLIDTENAIAANLSDQSGSVIRIYDEGKGQIVMLADNQFTNTNIGAFDHAEILLKLVQLQQNSKNVLIVQRVDITSWATLLWRNFHFAILASGLFLCLLFWRAIRRFGPILPEPQQARRSLIEHVDASAKWLWRSVGGSDMLLEAARRDTLKTLIRRLPQLEKMSDTERIVYLAEQYKMNATNVRNALTQPAAKLAHEYTKQIQTLQKLRQFYERKS